MVLSCFYTGRRLLRYMDGTLDAHHVRIVENHLLGCGRCRERLLSLKSGQRLASLLPRQLPHEDSWPAIEAALQRRDPHESSKMPAKKKPSRVYRPGFRSAVTLLLGAALMVGLQHVAGVVWRATPRQPVPVEQEQIDASNFHPVSIDDIRLSDEPHVVAEGYVSDLGVDSDDGDLTFKLVDRLDRPGPFVICEILDSSRLSPPKIGSRVKVYGVSRYDSKADHGWYELHPVMDIEPASR